MYIFLLRSFEVNRFEHFLLYFDKRSGVSLKTNHTREL